MSSNNGLWSPSPNDRRTPVPGQLSNLPGTSTFVTGHDGSGKAIVHSARHAKWKPFDNNTMAFNQVWTTHNLSDLNEEKDVAYHDEAISKNMGLVHKNGSVCRMVDFAPEYECLFHRTQSVDYGIVVEGSVEMILDDGNTTLLRRGDIAIQRATIHKWRNPSKTEWTRMVFVLQDITPLVINGKKFGEDLGKGTEGLPPSGNDD